MQRAPSWRVHAAVLVKAAANVCRFIRKLDRTTYAMSDEPPALSAYLAGIVYHGRHAVCSTSTRGECRTVFCRARRSTASHAQLY